MEKMNHAFLAGSFDPPTLGHLDLIERTSQLIQQVTVAIAQETSRKETLFALEQRHHFLTLLCAPLHNVHVITYSGLTVTAAQQCKATLLVRGVRGASDLDYELSLAAANRKLATLETLLLPANPALMHISGRLVREIGRSGHSLDDFVPDAIKATVQNALR